ncbi:hypothetical protein BDR03DRAFT_1006231 [Suillus americanus]|nr:hypothetical protein BDR03DRAFT_1006231 [Suillus americanus]
MVSTVLEIEPSLQDEIAVNMFGHMSVRLFVCTAIIITKPFAAVDTATITDCVICVYFIQCSLSGNTTYGIVDMQTNSLLSPIFISQPSMQWEMNQFESSNISWQAQIGSALATPDSSSGSAFDGMPAQIVEPSIAGKYIMSLVAEQLGTSNGGIQRGNGTAYVNEEFIALRLNINLLPLAFAASASVIMLGLALHMTRAFDALHNSQVAIPNIGVVMKDVQHPAEGNLRRAGMIDVCLSRIISDEGELGNSTASDSLPRSWCRPLS